MSRLRDIKLESSYIVKYVDFEEGAEFDYLVLQLCEYDLDEYMHQLRQREEGEKMETLKKLAKHVLLGLKAVHDARILHRHIKPSNVLIDVTGNARLADFGISRALKEDESARNTPQAGSRKWEAAEILESGRNSCDHRKSTDIQVAGMLVHYILSDGHHPFDIPVEHTGHSSTEQTDNIIEANIKNGKYSLQVIDVEAKDLIERMIKKNPEERLKIEDAVDHPYFWDDERRDTFLHRLGDEDDVQKKRKCKNDKLLNAVKKYTTFSDWKSKISEVVEQAEGVRPPDPSFTDDLRGLIRYLRNLLVHASDFFHQNNRFKDLFPDFFISAHKLAKEMGWKY
ncbi:hypothetical protein MHYP_G00155530 [Metynnis hypsauchen]